jgi:methylated-DNA-[protein]-cysteine S-methyltransferase
MNYRYAVFETKGGWLGAVFSLDGLYSLTLPCATELQATEQLALDRYSKIVHVWQMGILKEDLDRYFAGEVVNFHTLIDWSGYTDFQRQVLHYTAAIPFGQAVSYGDVAKAIQNPKACRAVGQALHINRTPIIVPCHRVLASGKKIGGFGGGLEEKRRLLALEKIEFTE